MRAKSVPCRLFALFARNKCGFLRWCVPVGEGRRIRHLSLERHSFLLGEREKKLECLLGFCLLPFSLPDEIAQMHANVLLPVWFTALPFTDRRTRSLFEVKKT